MNKSYLSRETKDGTQLTIEQIAAICPSAVTEVRDENTGEIVRKVNFTTLRQLLGDLTVDTPREAYDFTWVGKNAARREAAAPIDMTLRPCVEESKEWDTTKNLYIEGDNLQVLKLLQNYYAGQIKMIYIDPPYNTGKDFVYHDDFHQLQSDYEAAASVRDGLGNRYYANKNTNGRFHSDWCSMIYSRLYVAQTLLDEDGIIFISIGDDELKNLKNICDEVFGETNFIAQFVWEKTQHFGRQKLNSYSNNDFVLCYGKNIYQMPDNKLKELLVENIKTDLQDAPLFNASNNINTLSFPIGSTKFNMRDGVYHDTTNDDYELLDPVEVKDGYNANVFRLRFRSRWSNNTVQEEVKKGTIFWVKTTSFAIRAIYGEGRSSTDAPRQIIFTNTTNPMATKDRIGKRIDTSENATNKLAQMMNRDCFDYPKPVSLIKYFCSLVYDRHNLDFNKDGIVLDFFSGSSTTAQAVMELNAEDGGSRKFIMIQLPENLDENLKVAEPNSKITIENAISICDSINAPHLITEIAKERIRRAGKKIKEENPNVQDLDTGFRVLKLDESNFKQVSFPANQYSQDMLAGLWDNIKDDRTDLDLLFDCMLRWGVELSLPIERTEADHCQILNVNDGDLVACLDRNGKVTEDVIDAIADMQPLRIVLLDTAFEEASQKMNIYELFKQRLGWSDDQASKQIRVI